MQNSAFQSVTESSSTTIPTPDLGPPQVSAKFGTAAGWAKDAPRNGGDRMSDNYRMGGDRVGDMGGDRYPPSYDRGGGGGGGGYATSRDERGYGGGGGYDRPAPIYREERGRDRDREPPREVSRELPRYEPRGRSPPPAYYDDRRRVGGSGGGYDDRYGPPLRQSE